MKAVARHSLIRILMACAAVGLSHDAFAQLHITGTVPVGARGSNGGIVILLPTTQLANRTNYTVSGLLKFKFRAHTPASVTRVAYAVNFCVGAATNPCGGATSIVVTVNGGGPGTFALIDASAFAGGNVLGVVNPTATPVRFEVDLE
jgi:hypothetical protein